MKLIFCPECQDIIKLQKEKRICLCGKSSGYYEEDGLHAVISGEAIPLGINNTSFQLALMYRPKSGLGEEFKAFVIPEKVETIRKE